jgi:RNA polymerase sigma-70 factor, ECF subfamily
LAATERLALPVASHSQRIHSGLDQPSDSDLLARLVAGEQQAFAMLVERHFQAVHRVVWRMMDGHADAEDVAQEAFLRLWRNPQQLRDGAALKGWLMRVATNVVMDRYRAKPPLQIDEEFDIADERSTAEEVIDRRRAAASVDAAIASLPERQKLALTLVHLEQLSNTTAAEVMNLSVEAVESLLARARRNLKDRLSPNKNVLLATLAAERM